MNGLINIYKEAGFTSHDVVAKLRGILHMKKIGHTGTLDPDAVGVLPVCLGRGTKLCSMITDWDKSYKAVMLLGRTTDTQDISGTTLTESEVNVTAGQIIEAVNSFVGDYSQIPPMYSALKHNGKKLYELAREGVEIERQPRLVNISSIKIDDVSIEGDEKLVTMTVDCSKGTYIRTLCHDIGEKLGCGACMKHLTRVRVGKFSIEDSLTLSKVEELVNNNQILSAVEGIDDMFDYPKLTAGEEYNKLLYNGNSLPAEKFSLSEDESFYRVYDENSSFIGIYEKKDDILKLIKMFYEGIENK